VVALTSYVFNHYELSAVADIGEQYDPETGKGTLVRNYCCQAHGSAPGFFDEQLNTFMGAGALGMGLDDYNGDNFDHSDLAFLHGGNMAHTQTEARPILSNTVPAGTPSWCAEFRE